MDRIKAKAKGERRPQMNADDTDEKTKARAKPSGSRGTAQGPSPTTAGHDAP